MIRRILQYVVPIVCVIATLVLCFTTPVGVFVLGMLIGFVGLIVLLAIWHFGAKFFNWLYT